MLPLPAIRDPMGKPLLSWRVTLLPYMGESKLYKEFHLDEPWDSEHNKRLIDRPAKRIFRHSDGDDDGTTRFLAVVGDKTAFPPNAKAGISRIPDGETNTIIVVEVGPDKAVPWTKPEDFAFDPQSPKSGLGEIGAEGFLVMFGGKSVKLVRSAVDEKLLAAFFTRNGGEPAKPEELE